MISPWECNMSFNTLEIQAKPETLSAYEILQSSYMSKQPETNIFDYVDFRIYLKDFFAAKKKIDGKYSQRFIIQKVGASSSGWYSDLIAGRKKLSSTFQMRLVQLLHIGPREQQYFNALVKYNQADGHEIKESAYKYLLDFHEIKPETLGHDQYEFFTKWYYTAIREHILLHSFDGDFNSLARHLIPAITPIQAKEAVTLLQKLDLVERSPLGIWKPKSEHIRKDNNTHANHFINYLKANMGVAMKALEELSREERDFSALTIGLDEAGFAEVKDDIQALKEKMKAISARIEEGGRVYQILIQAFPMTRALK